MVSPEIGSEGIMAERVWNEMATAPKNRNILVWSDALPVGKANDLGFDNIEQEFVGYWDADAKAWLSSDQQFYLRPAGWIESPY
jgi:hypothetical protein